MLISVIYCALSRLNPIILLETQFQFMQTTVTSLARLTAVSKFDTNFYLLVFFRFLFVLYFSAKWNSNSRIIFAKHKQGWSSQTDGGFLKRTDHFMQLFWNGEWFDIWWPELTCRIYLRSCIKFSWSIEFIVSQIEGFNSVRRQQNSMSWMKSYSNDKQVISA